MNAAFNCTIILATITLANATEVFDLSDWRRPLFAGLLLLSLITRSWPAVSCTLIFFALHFYSLIVPSAIHALPVLGFLIPFLFSTAILRALPPTRDYFGWFSRGKIDQKSWLLVGGTSLISTMALILWAYWTKNLGYGAQIVEMFSSSPKWLVCIVFVPAFALLNAFAEEVVFRGILQESLSRAFKSELLVILLQCVTFGAFHYEGGFPNGVMGLLMASVYGVALGYLRLRTKGILAPYLAHVIADTTIACLLIKMAS